MKKLNNKKLIDYSAMVIFICGSLSGIIYATEKVVDRYQFNKRVDATALVSEDYDYSKDLSESYDFNLDNSIDKFILLYNKNLSTKDIWSIKSLTKKYTESLDDYNLMLSLYSVESNFYKNANSFLGAEYGRGLGQVSEVALKEYNRKNRTNIKPDELYNMETNIKVSCWLYYYYQGLYNLDTVGTLMVYNKGYKGYNRDRNDIGYSEKILNNKIKLG